MEESTHGEMCGIKASVEVMIAEAMKPPAVWELILKAEALGGYTKCQETWESGVPTGTTHQPTSNIGKEILRHRKGTIVGYVGAVHLASALLTMSSGAQTGSTAVECRASIMGFVAPRLPSLCSFTFLLFIELQNTTDKKYFQVTIRSR
jgi:hypothetical protein